jgi:hypothetical protein
MSTIPADRAEAMEVFDEVFGDAVGKIAKDLPVDQMDRKVDELLVNLDSLGVEAILTRDSYRHIIDAGFRGENLPLAALVAQICVENHPLVLRSVFYQVVSAGLKPSTDDVHYKAVGRVLKRLRRDRVVPYSWVIDSMRSTVKPSSWSGIGDYLESVKDQYRRNFWLELPDYVHIIAEKDAIAGVVQPVTNEYDVALSPLRGYASDSFIYSIADTWNAIKKPIHVAYLGDFDPSGMDIEADCKCRLSELCEQKFSWVRLGVNAEQFKEYNLLPLKPKKQDKRYKSFVATHGHDCAEIDAIPANELRRMVREFIEGFIPTESWEALKRTEELERETFSQTIRPLLQEAKVL